MITELEKVLPMEIEKRSFEIIESELPHPIDPALAPIIKRVIHTSADFDYADNLCFSEDKEDGLTVAMAVDDAVFMEPVYRSFREAVYDLGKLLRWDLAYGTG